MGWTTRVWSLWQWNGQNWHAQLNVWWKPADLWVGAFVKPSRSPLDPTWRYLDVYICLLPCLPLHVHCWWTVREDAS
jgi:hypothetical protein